MRPLELKLAHFGPYRHEATLNFEALDRLFLVCGPTGAGKTTLFDALTYALYERTPGTRGALGDQLASHHAPEGAIPWVSLKFALGSQVWRVTRHLKHRIRKQRGDGWRDQDAQVLLESLVGEAWEPVPGKRTEINQRLEEMIGLSAEEFGKIVVLPQGDFQRFLEASSNDREKMLQKLFPIEAYERLVEGLKAQAKVAETERRRWEDRWEDLTATLGPHPEDLGTLEAAEAEARVNAEEATQAEAEAAVALDRLQGLARDWATLESKRRESAQLEGRRAPVDRDRARVEAGRLARPWGADLDRQERILADGKALRAVQDAAKDQSREVAAQQAEWEARAPQRAAQDARLTDLVGQRALLEAQKQAWDEAQGWQAQEDQARVAEAAALATYERSTQARVAAEAGMPPAPEGPDWDEALRRVDRARVALDDARAAATLEARRRDLETATDRERQAVVEGQRALDHATAEVTLWAQLAEAVKAASLARNLAPGLPCPVCGSTEHPRLAPVTEAEAETPRRLEEALGAQAHAAATLALGQTRTRELVEELGALPPPASGSPGVPEATEALAQAQGFVEALQAWRRAQESAQKALTLAVEAQARDREAWLAAVRARETWTTRRTTLADAVPEDPRPKLTVLVREEADLRQAIETDRRLGEALGREAETLRTRIDEQEKQLSAQREEFARIKASLEAGLARQGWTLADLVAARLPEATLRDLEAAVAAFDREAHRLEGETRALEAKFPTGAPAPWEPARDQWEALKRAREAAVAEARDRGFALKTREKLEEDLKEVARARQAIEADFQRLVPLAQGLDGRNPLNLKLTTWVLIQALEAVAQSATHRLGAMSGGRYALKVQTQGLDGRKDWGLDLAVIDSYTGQERGVGTLSGGEKFMTSISLALGLADVIQERAGGLKLEAIFIDEGFGTLDDQSLDRAMAILHDLGKNRSVGLISHVADLRQRIQSRVEVIKDRTGSTLRVS